MNDHLLLEWDSTNESLVILTEPENDNFVEVVLGFREKLGWLNKLPRHGPGSRKAMDAIQDKPDPEKHPEVR